MARVARLPRAPTAVPRAFTLTLEATGAGGTTTSRARVAESASASGLVASLTPSTATLSSAGGEETLDFAASPGATCTLTSSPEFWTVGPDPMSVPCDGSYVAVVAAGTAETTWTFSFTATGSSGRSTTATGTLVEVAPVFGESLNWAGYVLGSLPGLTAVAGEWTVPTLACATTPDAGVSSWVGLGGFTPAGGVSSGGLLQTGTEEECAHGGQQNSGWWELTPSSLTASKNFTGFPVAAGDVISASVVEIPSNCGSSCITWETSLDDLTTGLSGVMITGDGWGVSSGESSGSFANQGSTAALSYAGADSAEWIVEDSSTPGGLESFVDFGSVAFTNVLADLGPPDLAAADGVEMVQNGTALAVPSLPGGSGFSVAYTG
jgi:hypothetical protein